MALIQEYSTRDLIDELEKAIRIKNGLLENKDTLEKALAYCDNSIAQNDTVIDTLRTELGVRNGVSVEQ